MQQQQQQQRVAAELRPPTHQPLAASSTGCIPCSLLSHSVSCRCCVACLLLQIRTLCLSPDGQLLLSIDENGRALLIARTRRVLLHHFSFKGPVAAAAFSPDGKYVAVAVGRLLQVR
jgi:WD40 repeat protein